MEGDDPGKAVKGRIITVHVGFSREVCEKYLTYNTYILH